MYLVTVIKLINTEWMSGAHTHRPQKHNDWAELFGHHIVHFSYADQDLSPLDYFFSGYLKHNVYKTKSNDINY